MKVIYKGYNGTEIEYIDINIRRIKANSIQLLIYWLVVATNECIITIWIKLLIVWNESCFVIEAYLFYGINEVSEEWDLWI